MNIIFNSDGTATCLHSDEIPLQSLGHLKVRRASTIEFDEGDQEWVVRGKWGGAYFSDASREVCLAWEKKNWETFV